MKRIYLLIASICISTLYADQFLPSFEATPEWSEKIRKIAPEKPQAIPTKKRTALVFSLITGFEHWCAPHTADVVKILGEKSGAYDVVVSNDISNFEPKNIKKFDLIILNNTCSKRPERHLFFDVLQDMEKAVALEKSLIAHIEKGHGLAVFHGGIVMLNKSKEFSDLLGGSFHFHPKQQTVIGKLVNPEHAITKAFNGKALVHIDEPYYFNNAYLDFKFHPLLEMQIEVNPDPSKERGTDIKRYISWIKPYGKGRVFYCSPSHNAQSFEQPALLEFMLNGLQYAAGDLKCDDSPLNKQ